MPAISSAAASTDAQVFVTSLCMVGVAELFDKTWFMGLILALRYSAATVFVGSFAALFLHTVMAAAFGYVFARLLQPHVLNFLAAGLFLMFAVLYTKDCAQADADSDVIANGREEVADEVDLEPRGPEGCVENADENADARTSYGAAALKQHGKVLRSKVSQEAAALMKAFIAVFIAEWGDRTQIAMIGQHASQPLMPVFMGSCVAFFLLTLSAVGVAQILNGQQLSERIVFAVSAVCFYAFAALASKDAVVAMHEYHSHGIPIIPMPHLLAAPRP